MAGRVAIFIDGAYLDRVRQDEFSGVRIDFEIFVATLATGNDLLRMYYYDCPLYQDNPPTPDQRTRTQNRRTFFARLNRLPRFEVRLGRLERRLGPDGHPTELWQEVDERVKFNQAFIDSVALP